MLIIYIIKEKEKLNIVIIFSNFSKIYFYTFNSKIKIKIKLKKMRQPGIEPGPTAWKAAILTFRLLSQLILFSFINKYKRKIVIHIYYK